MLMDKMQKGLIGLIGIGVAYLTFLVFGLHIILVAVAVGGASMYLAGRIWAKLRQKGLITFLSPRLRQALLQRSILDIFRDIVYFPFITKIIGAYIHIAASKPHPMALQDAFKQLPIQIAEASNKKGLLSLTPSFVEEFVLPSQNRDLLPHNYGIVDEKWDNFQRYNKGQKRIHEQTIQKRAIHFLDGKLGWPTAFGLLACTVIGVTHMKPHRFKRMLLQNGTFACMVLCLIALLIKVRKAMRHQNRQILAAIEEKQE